MNKMRDCERLSKYVAVDSHLGWGIGLVVTVGSGESSSPTGSVSRMIRSWPMVGRIWYWRPMSK